MPLHWKVLLCLAACGTTDPPPVPGQTFEPDPAEEPSGLLEAELIARQVHESYLHSTGISGTALHTSWQDMILDALAETANALATAILSAQNSEPDEGKRWSR